MRPGDITTIGDRRFWCVGNEPYRTKQGEDIQLLTTLTMCRACGDFFIIKYSERSQSWLNKVAKNCYRHRGARL
jgi:hypothetical protein